MLKKLYLILLLSVSVLIAGENYIHHDLNITVNPAEQSIRVTDNIRLPKDRISEDYYFILHASLQISNESSKVEIKKSKEKIIADFFKMAPDKFEPPEDIPYTLYKISGLEKSDKGVEFSVVYEGKIHHPVQNIAKEYARGFSETPGIISEEGVYLGGASYWLPWFNDDLVTFNMTVTLDPAWRAVSQGKRAMEEILYESYSVRWESPEPMDEVYLIAARFSEYKKQIGNVNVLAYLRTPDESLASKYLETTAQYLDMYNQLIGPYPYTKFALIENFWETGYGMPSFTLLGEKVIRFPFILHSSYPHELLHNWWGNSVFVDYDTGNWCEGLTAYMADHLIKEQRGQGAEYRRGALQAYTDYVNEKNEFPLIEFLSRFDAASSSIGYNKSMMLFNMLRLQVGDEAFQRAMQRFYRDNKFKRSSYNDIRLAFESVTESDFQPFFDQWVNRKGAPVLEIVESKVSIKDDQYILSFQLAQVQEGADFDLLIPIAVHFDGQTRAVIKNVEMNKKQQDFDLIFENRPIGIDVDPRFDVFRRLHRNEIPPSLSQVFGAEKIKIILSESEDPNRQAAYEKMAQNWAKSDPEQIEIIKEKELSELPSDCAIWIFGLSNKFKTSVIEALQPYRVSIDADKFQIEKSMVSATNNSIILATRNPGNQDQVVVWLSADNDAALPGLGRKLPHYGKYSYLAFEGDEPTNILKGQWPAVNSPLSAAIVSEKATETDFQKGSLPVREALATLAPVFSEERMLQHVQYLASEELTGRGLGSEGLEKSAQYIADHFQKAGLKPGGDNSSFFQIWQEKGGESNELLELKNVIGILLGKKPEWSDQSLIICAHYDHLGLGWPDVREGNKGKIHYGADDNASGVAVLLEIADLLGKRLKPDRTVIFIAFSGEESGLRGSRYYVKNTKMYPAKKIIGALNLDTVGRLGKNKIHVLSGSSASEWKHIAMGIGFVTGINYELVAQDLDASDQVSFIEAGIPAIQLFSGPNYDYHRPEDSAVKIDAAGMVKIATFTREALLYLIEREDPMTFTAKTSSAKKPAAATSGRRVGTGMMPDFAFRGQGVRAADVTADSPAAQAGLQKGDVIIQLGDKPVTNLREYSDVLKSFKPGDTTTIVYERDGKKIEKNITLKAR